MLTTQYVAQFFGHSGQLTETSKAERLTVFSPSSVAERALSRRTLSGTSLAAQPLTTTSGHRDWWSGDEMANGASQDLGDCGRQHFAAKAWMPGDGWASVGPSFCPGDRRLPRRES